MARIERVVDRHSKGTKGKFGHSNTPLDKALGNYNHCFA